MTTLNEGLIRCDDGIIRCWWAGTHEAHHSYHDQEWGFPADNDRQLFEKLCLEGFQSGLSWLTILLKRERFREVFHQFDYHKVASMGDDDIERLVQDKGIVRHRGKIAATISNAKQAVLLEREFGGLRDYFWTFTPKVSERPTSVTFDSIKDLSQSPASRAMSKDLKKRGWKFVGPTTCYAFMQSVGIVNDHLEGCPVRVEVAQATSRVSE